jgi:hypothetical protein
MRRTERARGEAYDAVAKICHCGDGTNVIECDETLVGATKKAAGR